MKIIIMVVALLMPSIGFTVNWGYVFQKDNDAYNTRRDALREEQKRDRELKEMREEIELLRKEQRRKEFEKRIYGDE
jgi:hypothetical protein